VLASGEEFDADDVLACLYAEYTDEIAEYSTNLLRDALHRRVTTELKCPKWYSTQRTLPG
jgi:hypothetical protein